MLLSANEICPVDRDDGPVQIVRSGAGQEDDNAFHVSGVPHRLAGIRSRISLLRMLSSISFEVISVAIYPGATALTLSPLVPAHSLASALVN